MVSLNSSEKTKSLAISTIAFTVCFAVWTIFSIIGIQIKQNLGLNDSQFGLLVAMPILTGSLSRIFLGIWTDQFGGRIVYFCLMITTSLATWLLSTVSTYEMYLLAALGVGLAGGSFAVGIAYVSRYYESEEQGTALGIFGMGNVGAAVTSFGAPFLLIAYGWENVAKIYAVVLFVMAIIFWFTTEEDPVTKARKARGEKVKPALMQLEPLKHLRVWRFATYYFFVFGGYVALALWLPRYYMGVYDLEIQVAGMLAAAYALPGSIFRALGGYMSDKIGARKVMYITFIASLVCLFLLSYPATDYRVHGIEGPIEFTIAIGLVPFVLLTILLGFSMSLGKAAVYKHIPVYYPDHVGSVGGLVGLIGGLGGFILPISFGLMNDLIGVWSSCFMLLFAIVAISLIWMHIAILISDKRLYPDSHGPQVLPEMLEEE
ncbi:MAG: NarK/NasA family nitrate transporter [Methylococcales symbiont of Iophon sp. n. MRB-2018]|nr:MAG: NarK/NasA family nitrate transporter [Methylococcales symbiont of Iophon sp. n. MRB-2018]KAF3979893.1 MAG: NarK/NasA family nitrate transporter [Methylococcales symbiont of Iophon sp. n. MRB-2018]